MGVQRTLGGVARELNRRLGILAWLAGEPRPPAGGFDLDGEKFLDWAWICVNLPRGAKRALDVGSGQSPIVPAMLELGYEVTAVDLFNGMSQQLRGFTFIQADFNSLKLEPGFDVIVACSTVEHIGLSGRFGSAEDENGRQNIGYDIEGRTPDNADAFVEVKAIDHPGQAFTLTSNEEAVARQKGKAYRLVLVRQAGEHLEIAFIEDPINNLKLTRQCRQWVWECSGYDFNPERFALE